MSYRFILSVGIGQALGPSTCFPLVLARSQSVDFVDPDPMKLCLCLILALLTLPGAPVPAQEDAEVHAHGYGDILWGDPFAKAEELWPEGTNVPNSKLSVRLGYRSADTYHADQILRLDNGTSLFFFDNKFIGLYRSVPASRDIDVVQQEERIRRAVSDDGAIDLSALVVRVLLGQRAPFRARPVGLLIGNHEMLETAAAEFFRREDEKKRTVADELTLKLLGRWEAPESAPTAEPETPEAAAESGAAPNAEGDPFGDPRKAP